MVDASALLEVLLRSPGPAALADLGGIPLRRWLHEAPLPCVRVPRRHLAACDAAQFPVAEVLEATPLTRDARLASAVGCGRRAGVG